MHIDFYTTKCSFHSLNHILLLFEIQTKNYTVFEWKLCEQTTTRIVGYFAGSTECSDHRLERTKKFACILVSFLLRGAIERSDQKVLIIFDFHSRIGPLENSICEYKELEKPKKITARIQKFSKAFSFFCRKFEVLNQKLSLKNSKN